VRLVKLVLYHQFYELENANLEDLLALPDIGPIAANAILKFFHNDKTLAICAKLINAGVCWTNTELLTNINSLFLNKSIVLTGTLINLAREDAKELLEKAGAKISSSVSKKTDFVIVGDNPGSKYQKALELGIKVLSEDEMLKML